MTTTKELGTNLPTLASQINAEHEACEKSARSAIGHAMRAGELLIEAKAQVEHGQWLPWLKDNFAGSARTAQAYTRVARNRSELESYTQTSAHLSIDAAVRMLASSKPDTEPNESFDDQPPVNWRMELLSATGWALSYSESVLGYKPGLFWMVVASITPASDDQWATYRSLPTEPEPETVTDNFELPHKHARSVRRQLGLAEEGTAIDLDLWLEGMSDRTRDALGNFARLRTGSSDPYWKPGYGDYWAAMVAYMDDPETKRALR